MRISTLLFSFVYIYKICYALSAKIDDIGNRNVEVIHAKIEHKFPFLVDGKYGSYKNVRDSANCDNQIKTLHSTIKMLAQQLEQYNNRVNVMDKMLKDQQRTLAIIINNKNDKIYPNDNFDVSKPEEFQNTWKAYHAITENVLPSEENTNVLRDNVNKRSLASSALIQPSITTTDGIAFYAYMSGATQPITIQHPLVFDVVKANFGNGYHSSTGVFIAPETGVYVFTWTVRQFNGTYHSAQLMVNNDEIGIIHVYPTNGADIAGTAIVVTHVNAGDDVFVQTHKSWNHGRISSNSGGRTSYAGWKVF